MGVGVRAGVGVAARVDQSRVSSEGRSRRWVSQWPVGDILPELPANHVLFNPTNLPIFFVGSFPLAVAGSAALIAGTAWLNAKTQLSYDYNLVSSLIRASVTISRAERRDEVNLFYTLEKHANTRSTASSPFLIYNSEAWTFREVYDIVLQYGTWLKTNYAIQPREVVALDFMNCPQFIFLWLGLWSLGACPALINYNLTGQPLLHCIKTSTARILFVEEEVKSRFTQDVLDAVAAPGFRNGNGAVQVVDFNGDTETRILAERGLREPNSSRAGAQLHEMANLIYTSGTTGLPKPAVVSWNKIRLGGGFAALFLGLKNDDRFYTVSFSKSSSTNPRYPAHRE